MTAGIWINAIGKRVASIGAVAGLLWLAVLAVAQAAESSGHAPEATPLRLAQSSTTATPRYCPPGTTGVYPRCRPIVQRRCPRGTVGRYPNCRRIVLPKCPRGTVGRFPNCRKIVQPKCPRGTVGRFPNCRKVVQPKCPRGTVGRFPNCRKIVRPTCPRGTVGKHPNCRKIVRPTCPRGTVGKHPNCRKIVRPTCPSGTRGRWPKCTKVAKPKRPSAKPPQRARRTAPRPQPPRRVVTVPDDQRPDEVVVLLDRAQPGNVEFAIAQQYRLVRLQGENNQLLEARVQRYRIPDRRTPADVIAAMQGDPRITLAQPNYLYRLQRGKAAKPARGSMIKMQYAPISLQLDAAHKLATGLQARVAVIDSGVDRQHTELVDALVGTFNAVGDRKPKPDAHGTAIAGIIGARAKLLGVAPGVELLAVRAFFRERGGKPLTTTFVLLRAVDWSFTQKARVFNLSFTGPEDNAVRKILRNAHDRGSILVAAAGNAGPRAPPAYPAAYPHVLAITAHDKADKLYKKANRGGYVMAAAPGVDVLVPIPRGGYDVKSGTSFAAAHVSGLIALMLERNPGLTLDEVRAHITQAAHDLGPKGPDKLFGAGRADALGALQAVIGTDGPALSAGEKPATVPAAARR